VHRYFQPRVLPAGLTAGETLRGGCLDPTRRAIYKDNNRRCSVGTDDVGLTSSPAPGRIQRSARFHPAQLHAPPRLSFAGATARTTGIWDKLSAMFSRTP
jgi:hypothetical protein